MVPLHHTLYCSLLCLILFCFVCSGEEYYGTIVTNSSQHNILQFSFVQGGSINISFAVLPETTSTKASVNVNIVICSESDYYKLIENDHDNDLCENRPKCESNTYSQKTGTVQHTTKRYGRYYIDVFACPSSVPEVIVNWSASFKNDRSFNISASASHLNADLLPAVPSTQATGLLWCVAALAYLGTLRHHWKRASRLQKCIVVYPIMKVAFLYYSGSFYSNYSEHGYFTTTEWVWYWSLQIGIKSSFNFMLMLISITTTGLDSSRLKIRDIAFIFVITIGLLVISAMQCSYEVSQLSSLLMWMLSTTLYVMMMAYMLSGVTASLHKAGGILRSSIRRNVAHTRRRLRDRRLRRLHSSIAHSIQPSSNTSTSRDSSINSSLTNNNNTNNGDNNTEIHQVNEINNNNNNNNNISTNGISTSSNENNSTTNDTIYSTEHVTELRNSISYLMPYVWFMRYNLFISFKFVVIVWVILNVMIYFVNLVFGTSSLDWVSLMTNEILDFVIFSGIIYSFLMCSRSPISENTKADHNSRQNSQVYAPLLPTRSQQQQLQQTRQSNFEASRDRGVEIEEDGDDNQMEENFNEVEVQNEADGVDGTDEVDDAEEGEDGREDGVDGEDEDDEDEEVLIGRQLPIPGLII